MTFLEVGTGNDAVPNNIVDANELNDRFRDIVDSLQVNAYLGQAWLPLEIDGITFEHNTTNSIVSDIDLSSVIQKGDKITFEQPTDGEYFAFVTKIDWDTTVVGKTYIELFVYQQNAIEDEDIIGGTVGLSRAKNPWGFPLDEDGWSIQISNSTNYSQAVASNTSWYNLGGISITVPAGEWLLTYAVPVSPRNTTSSTQPCNQQAAIGTTTTENRVTGSITTTGSTSETHYGTLINTVPVNPTSSQIYYLQSRQGVSISTGTPEIRILGAALQPTLIKAILAYK